MQVSELCYKGELEKLVFLCLTGGSPHNLDSIASMTINYDCTFLNIFPGRLSRSRRTSATCFKDLLVSATVVVLKKLIAFSRPLKSLCFIVWRDLLPLILLGVLCLIPLDWFLSSLKKRKMSANHKFTVLSNTIPKFHSQS